MWLLIISLMSNPYIISLNIELNIHMKRELIHVLSIEYFTNRSLDMRSLKREERETRDPGLGIYLFDVLVTVKPWRGGVAMEKAWDEILQELHRYRDENRELSHQLYEISQIVRSSISSNVHIPFSIHSSYSHLPPLPLYPSPPPPPLPLSPFTPLPSPPLDE